jgi:hypothetical protein
VVIAPILRRMRQRPFVLRDLAQITANQSSRRRSAFDKVLGLVFRPSAHELADTCHAARRSSFKPPEQIRVG